MKKKILLGALFVIVFILGGIINNLRCNLEKSQSNENVFNEKILNLLENENEFLHCDVKNNINDSIDTTSPVFCLIKKADSLLTYFEYILSEEKYKEFSFNKILTDVDKDLYMDDINKLMSEINVNDNSTEQNKLFINLCENIIVNRYFKKYRESSLIINKAKCIMVADNDTVNLGDNFKGQIYFTITDISKRKKIQMDNGLKFTDGIYVEKANKRGLNKRTGIYRWYNGSRTILFPIEFLFFVK